MMEMSMIKKPKKILKKIKKYRKTPRVATKSRTQGCWVKLVLGWHHKELQMEY